MKTEENTNNELEWHDNFEEYDMQVSMAAVKCFEENELEYEEDCQKYEHYDTANRGCSIDNPFVVNDDSDVYTSIEYRVLDHLFGNTVSRFDYNLKLQELIEKDDRWYDCLTIIASFADGTTSEEKYWFDITTGISRENKRLKKLTKLDSL